MTLGVYGGRGIRELSGAHSRMIKAYAAELLHEVMRMQTFGV